MSTHLRGAQTLKPHTRFASNSATFSFCLGDCVDIPEQLEPGSIGAIVTSPPYNLGIRYRAARAMAADGSLFLNVGAKPTNPWTAIAIGTNANLAGRLLQTNQQPQNEPAHWLNRPRIVNPNPRK
jgi:DNA modification methylase